ncbi:MAG: hypothetical protein JJE22_13605 [Bacteroidia bacterium]|nr:hypothetical protein [Bacteroidia bacterium]
MKKLLFLFVFTGIAFFAYSQKDPQKVTVARPATAIKIIPSAKAVVVRKDVVKLKAQLVQLSDSITVTKTEINRLADNMKSDLDSMSEMGETESLRLQMAMDRLSKMMSTLSNLLKKISDTQQSITQNIK